MPALDLNTCTCGLSPSALTCLLPLTQRSGDRDPPLQVGKTFEQWENRTALFISGGALLAWLCTRGSPDALGFGFDYGSNFHRTILIFPILRLFFTLKQARRN